MTAVQERPAGRLACVARPAGARIDGKGPHTGPQAEFQRLIAVGVSASAAAVLASACAPPVDERAYWRQISYGRPTTGAQRAAHAACQRARRQMANQSRHDEVTQMSTTSDRNDPRLSHGANDEPVPMAEVYLVLSEGERAAGFVRPVRDRYIHVAERGGCGVVTTMGRPIAETYARNPSFYGATYCVGCRMHRPVGAEGEFDWTAEAGEIIAPSYQRVGS